MKKLWTVEQWSDPQIRWPETWRYIDRCLQQWNADKSMYVDLKKRIHCSSCKKHYLDYFNRNSWLPPFEYFHYLYNEIQERKSSEWVDSKTRTLEEYADYLWLILS